MADAIGLAALNAMSKVYPQTEAVSKLSSESSAEPKSSL